MKYSQKKEVWWLYPSISDGSELSYVGAQGDRSPELVLKFSFSSRVVFTYQTPMTP
jgi:hypothetical protein